MCFVLNLYYGHIKERERGRRIIERKERGKRKTKGRMPQRGAGGHSQGLGPLSPSVYTKKGGYEPRAKRKIMVHGITFILQVLENYT